MMWQIAIFFKLFIKKLARFQPVNVNVPLWSKQTGNDDIGHGSLAIAKIVNLLGEFFLWVLPYC